MRKTVLLAVICTALVLVTAYGDTIVLNSGRSVRGRIIEETADDVVIKQESGVTTRINRDDIVEIVRAEDLEKEYKSKLAKVKPEDTRALMELAAWCKEHSLKKQQRELLEQILKLEPENADAKREMSLLKGELPEKKNEEKESDGITFAPGNGESTKNKKGEPGSKKSPKIWKDDEKKVKAKKKGKSKVQPPLGGSSKGTGGRSPVNGTTFTAGGATFDLIVPASYNSSKPNPMMIVYSGVEGRKQMTQNLLQLRGRTGTGHIIFAVLDGRSSSASHGAAVIDELRSKYNIDNDKTYLLSESAGTRAGLQLGFELRQSYFAAFWANDVTCSGKPKKKASELGFKPHGNSGPGGNFPAARAIVAGMKEAGYRLPKDAPYSGPGAGVHGDQQQFIAALKFFPGKSRN
jgi:hypothetical protein